MSEGIWWRSWGRRFRFVLIIARVAPYWEGKIVRFIAEVPQVERWELQKVLVMRNVPPKVRGYV